MGALHSVVYGARAIAPSVFGKNLTPEEIEKKKAAAEEAKKPKTPVRTDRVRPGFKIAEVDQWIKEDMALPENQPVASKFTKGDRVKEKTTEQVFTVHDITHQGVLLLHPGGAFKYGCKDEDLERV